jgi:DNA-binding beta-propeller fold protein YncE
LSSADSFVAIVTPGPTLPWTATTVTSGFITPKGIVFDGVTMWLSDSGLLNRQDGTEILGSLFKLDNAGAVLQTVTVGINPSLPVFDGTNIWVPNSGSHSVSVVRASTGSVLATLTGNGLNTPVQAAFDGERVLLTNFNGASVSLWKAADLTPAGSFPMPSGGGAYGACTDGIGFWISLPFLQKLARF